MEQEMEDVTVVVVTNKLPTFHHLTGATRTSGVHHKQEEHDDISTTVSHELESALRGELKKLQKYYAENTGSLLEQCLHLSEITGLGYVQGCPFTKLKQLNPTSRDHIAWILQTHESGNQHRERPQESRL